MRCWRCWRCWAKASAASVSPAKYRSRQFCRRFRARSKSGGKLRPQGSGVVAPTRRAPSSLFCQSCRRQVEIPPMVYIRRRVLNPLVVLGDVAFLVCVGRLLLHDVHHLHLIQTRARLSAAQRSSAAPEVVHHVWDVHLPRLLCQQPLAVSRGLARSKYVHQSHHFRTVAGRWLCG